MCQVFGTKKRHEVRRSHKPLHETPTAANKHSTSSHPTSRRHHRIKNKDKNKDKVKDKDKDKR
jgi:hypothetical protein